MLHVIRVSNLARTLMRRPRGLQPISSRADPSDATGAFIARFPRFDVLAILHFSKPPI